MASEAAEFWKRSAEDTWSPGSFFESENMSGTSSSGIQSLIAQRGRVREREKHISLKTDDGLPSRNGGMHA